VADRRRIRAVPAADRGLEDALAFISANSPGRILVANLTQFEYAKLYGRMASERRSLYYLTPGVETCRLEYADSCALIALRYLVRAQCERRGMSFPECIKAAENASSRVQQARYERSLNEDKV
jgi:hypothetical protein